MRLEAAIARARECVARKVPHVHLGRSMAGMDCVGLVAYALALDESAVPGYGRDPFAGQLERALRAHFGEPITDEPRAGDVVAMRWGGPIRHVGILADHPDGGLSIIHSVQTVGRATEHGIDHKTKWRIVMVFRPEFEE